LQVRAVRWDPDACTSTLISHTATATLTPTQSASRTTSATTTRSPSLSPSPASFCNIRTVAGTGTQSSTGDGGQASIATLNIPFGLAVNGSLVYIGEDGGWRVRRLDTATGIITTYAGTGGGSGAYLGVAATSANLRNNKHATMLPNGDFAITLFDRCTVLAINAATGITYAVAGTGTCLTAGQAASSGVAANATAFGNCNGIAGWGADGVFVSTLGEHRVRLVNLTTGAWMGVKGGWALCSPRPIFPSLCRSCPHVGQYCGHCWIYRRRWGCEQRAVELARGPADPPGRRAAADC
jgi:hypothetical protein